MTRIYNKQIIKERRIELRSNQTPSESILREILRDRRLDGLKFKRQYSVNFYILDFYCPDQKLGIELDGKSHNESDQKVLDIERTKIMEELGIEIIRFANEEVISNIDKVIEEIKKVASPPKT